MRATLEVHRNSPCLSCIVSKFHHQNSHVGMPMDDKRTLFSALGSYLVAFEDVFPCNCCKNFHSNLHGYCNAHRFSRFHHKFFSRCHLVPTAAEDVIWRSSFWAQKVDPERNGSSMFLLIVIRSKSGSRGENHPAVERVSLVQVGRFSRIYVGFDEHPKSRVIATQDFTSPSTVLVHFHPLVSNT